MACPAVMMDALLRFAWSCQAGLGWRHGCRLRVGLKWALAGSSQFLPYTSGDKDLDNCGSLRHPPAKTPVFRNKSQSLPHFPTLISYRHQTPARRQR